MRVTRTFKTKQQESQFKNEMAIKGLRLAKTDGKYQVFTCTDEELLNRIIELEAKVAHLEKVA